MTIVALLAALLALAGHGMLWVAVVNRLHATSWSPAVLKCVQVPIGLFYCAGPWLVYRATSGQLPGRSSAAMLADPSTAGAHAAWWYAAACLGVCVAMVVGWWRRRRRCVPSVLQSSTHEYRDVQHDLNRPLAGNRIGRWCAALPGNEIFQLEIVDKQLQLAALPDELDGLTIAHLSDLHLTGRVDVAYFEEVVRRSNAWEPDLVIVTGDILDAWECHTWLPSTLGRLEAREGVWFLLGNHDLRPGRVAELRRQLTDLGLIDLGGQCREFRIRGVDVLVAGNECPWFGPAPDVPPLPLGPRPFRLLLSHSPDQWPWARRRGFDLMLAGHTHGGQICFPLIGPVVSPSRFGVAYAGGLFEFGSLVMHVSRGLSGEEPLRWGCPPELPRLILRSGKHSTLKSREKTS